MSYHMMCLLRKLSVLGFLGMTLPSGKNAESALLPEIQAYTDVRVSESSKISDERKKQLEELSGYVQKCAHEKKPAKLIFVCTHNSRRSHFSQIWAQVASRRFGLSGVECFSGGTEATAMNPRTIAALRRAGLQIKLHQASEDNPHYAVVYQDDGDPLAGFSKVVSSPVNPATEFCAVMTCSQADKACPTVAGADSRIAISYEDPKVSDGTLSEAAVYDQSCAEIAREMLYVMSLVRT